jgi:hypothetical protein
MLSTEHPQAIARRVSWAPLAVLVVAQFMVVLDIAIVNVALPSIAADLGFTAADLQWVVTACADPAGDAPRRVPWLTIPARSVAS